MKKIRTERGSRYRPKKTGVMRTVVSSRKAIHVIIRGNPNNFLVSAGTGEWGKNFVVAGLFTGGIGLIGMGFNLRFTGKALGPREEVGGILRKHARRTG